MRNKDSAVASQSSLGDVVSSAADKRRCTAEGGSLSEDGRNVTGRRSSSALGAMEYRPDGAEGVRATVSRLGSKAALSSAEANASMLGYRSLGVFDKARSS